MQTLNLIVSLPAAPARLICEVSANDDGCDVMVAFARSAQCVAPLHEPACAAAGDAGDDDYVLGGYAGI
ncbi:MAG: hypothetical protein ABW154_09195 [Dyella sp.]